ncbi:MAG: hypothetical protein HC890_15120 [Chloroflexaceae bacterium]|nr:hypothetical protein [Chloroflexaceae bacterium]
MENKTVQLTIELPDYLYRCLEIFAEDNNVSIDAYISTLIDEKVIEALINRSSYIPSTTENRQRIEATPAQNPDTEPESCDRRPTDEPR